MSSRHWHTDTPDVLAIFGEVDISAGRKLRRALATHPDIRHIDCAGVTFVDSSGFDAVVDTATARSIRLVNPSTVFTRMLDLYDRFELWPDDRPTAVSAA